jgi:Domain of unknown function (DUF397)
MTHPGRVLGPDARGKVAWRISSYSPSAGGNCVEAGTVADQTSRVAIRHSHRSNGLALVVSERAWATFVSGVKNGEFAT